jgi:DNA polymerase III delta prime subunit/very-short-patch-repair endonuclease
MMMTGDDFADAGTSSTADDGDGAASSGAELSVSFEVVPRLSLAFHQNGVPPIGGIEVRHRGDVDLEDLKVRIVADLPFIAAPPIHLARVRGGSVTSVPATGITMDAPRFRDVTEAVRGSITCRVEDRDGNELALAVHPCDFLAPNEWTGIAHASELVAAFVLPNDPAVDVILHEASRKLAEAGRDPAFDGYASGRRERIAECAEAVWGAISDLQISYALPPASFERDGQRVRLPSDVRRARVGTCLDTTLLFAACLEQMHLAPLVVLLEGHALVGVWVEQPITGEAIFTEPQVLRKRAALREILLIETTVVTMRPAGQPSVTFDEACRIGASTIAEGAQRGFETAIDIGRIRVRNVRPLSLAPDGTIAVGDAPTGVSGIGNTPDVSAPRVITPAAVGGETNARIIDWKRRLLDLSLRNKLLNFRPGKLTIQFHCPDASSVEDRLAGGLGLRVVPTLSPSVVPSATGTVPVGRGAAFAIDPDDYAREALDRDEIVGRGTAIDLSDRLLEVYRTVRTSIEETGASTLFMVFGFVSWTPKPTVTRTVTRSGPSLAPLLLVPVALERRGARSDAFTIKSTDEPARINPTFIEMVRQDFGVTIQDVDPNTIVDDAGLDVRAIWDHVRVQIRDLVGFEVKEEVALSTFSFAKHLMWMQLGDQTAALLESPVVKRLVGQASVMPQVDEPAGLDARVMPTALRLPLQADSSQIAAIEAATRGANFVLYGPPGTGKSQTIANLIVHLLGEDKTVLFVSQKATALEVVQRRLAGLGLDPFCLELHSAKTQKSAFYEKLSRTWQFSKSEDAATWQADAARLGQMRARLNAYVDALHRKWPNGMTAFDAFGIALASPDLAPGVKLPFASPAADSPDAVRTRAEVAPMLATWFRAVEDPRRHPLRIVNRASWTASWQRGVEAAAARVATAAVEARGAADGVARLLGLAVTGRPATIATRLEALAALVNHLRADVAETGVRRLRTDRSALLASIASATQAREVATRARGGLALAYHDAIWQVDLDAAIAEWDRAAQSNVLVRWWRTRQAWKAVGIHATAERNGGARPADGGTELRALREVARFRVAADAAEASLASEFGVSVTEAAAVQAAITWADTAIELARAARIGPDNAARVTWLETASSLGASDPSSASVVVANGRAAMTELKDARVEFVQLTEPVPDWAGSDDDDAWLTTVEACAREVEGAMGFSRDWCSWVEAREAAYAAGLRPVVVALEGGAIGPGEVVQLAKVAHARGWGDAVVNATPELASFRGRSHVELVAQFRTLDAAVTSGAAAEIQRRLAAKVPRRGDVGAHPEWLKLSRQAAMRRGQMAVRRAIEEMPAVMRTLAPCLMMSPISIAQYLPAAYAVFDVVIFDEASQLPTWDAVGAIARGKQAIIAGDPKQLPPTNFFDRGDTDEDEDGDAGVQPQSVLDECLAANLPEAKLRWHYRSRHESLIAFSNERYYESDLITFPSPVTSDRAVRYVHVPSGAYDRGGKRTNRAEADAVVADIVRRLESHGDGKPPSIGVVTFNAEQQRLIQDLLDKVPVEHPTIAQYFGRRDGEPDSGNEIEEPVFVKNLETVQGDERDVILFSIGYGPDATGRVYMNFGPLNRQGGERRLNVAITRARHELVVFATLRADQMKLSPTTPDGVRDFKHFLEYAERGPDALVRVAGRPGGTVESPFEQSVKRLLEAHGWTVHAQVGVSGYRIDLGIVHPNHPGRYLAGVECDGATYHRSATARDRDRLREMVLRDLGWEIVRVWSPDWWADAVKEANAVHAQLEALLRDDRQRAAAAPPVVVTPAVTSLDDTPTPNGQEESVEAGAGTPAPDSEAGGLHASQVDTATPLPPMIDPPTPVPTRPTTVRRAPYVVANLSDLAATRDITLFYDPTYDAKLRRMVLRVIETEGPIYDSVLVTRIRDAHGFGRAADRMRQRIMGAVDRQIRRIPEVGSDRVVLCHPATDLSAIAFRESPSGQRDVEDIPIMELAALARTLDVGNKFDDEAVTALRDAIGGARVGAPMRARFMAAIEMARGR